MARFLLGWNEGNKTVRQHFKSFAEVSKAVKGLKDYELTVFEAKFDDLVVYKDVSELKPVKPFLSFFNPNPNWVNVFFFGLLAIISIFVDMFTSVSSSFASGLVFGFLINEFIFVERRDKFPRGRENE